MTNIYLKKGKERPIQRKHPWIFSGAFGDLKKRPDDGEWVEVLSADKKFVCAGHFAHGSIAVRILSFSPIKNKGDFYKEKIAKAFAYRKAMGLTDSKETTIYRLVYGEGDDLSGLIVDHYQGHLVVQCHTLGMLNDLPMITNALRSLPITIQTIYNKSQETISQSKTDKSKQGFLLGNTPEVIALENNVKFKINWVEGQKTGFFVDQRVNRELVGAYSKPDSKVLNVFSYTGGFSTYAGMNGAQVTSVDVSKKAIDLANENMALNGVENHEGLAIDAFEYIKNMPEDFDIVVLDPPAFAKRKSATHNAVQAYKRINSMALQHMKPGSFLFTYSCSQNISKQLFTDTIRAAAIEVGKTIRIVKDLGQPEDHPKNIYHPEGDYLKGLVLFIED